MIRALLKKRKRPQLALGRVPGIVSGMALEFYDGKWWTPGGCSAWHGRCFSGAAYDQKCSIGYIFFSRGGIYRAKRMPIWVFGPLFDQQEDPGCYWNKGTSKDFRLLFKGITKEQYDAEIVDYTWDPGTMLWTATEARTPEDWRIPCKPDDDDQ